MVRRSRRRPRSTLARLRLRRQCLRLPLLLLLHLHRSGPCAVSGLCVCVLVCGAYLGMLQHAIYKCAPQRCNIKYFSLVAVLAIVVVHVVVAIVARCCSLLLLSLPLPAAWPIMLSVLEGASIYEFIVRSSLCASHRKCGQCFGLL